MQTVSGTPTVPSERIGAVGEGSGRRMVQLASGFRWALPMRLAQFAHERFPPAAYGPLIAAFVACGYLGAAAASGVALHFDARVLLVGTVVTLAFFRMRAVDELKDAAVDRLGRPERPLPRGLVTAEELRAVALACVGAEVCLAAVLGPPAIVAYGAALVYSLLAARDFFAERVVHRDLVVYALVHSPIVPLLLALVWWSHPDAAFGAAFASLALLAWGVSLGLEVARKTMAPSEERPHVETYSDALGQPRAVMLAAGGLSVGALGAAAYALAINASTAAVVALAAAAAAMVLAGAAIRRSPRLDLARSCASVLGLALLLAPTALALGRG